VRYWICQVLVVIERKKERRKEAKKERRKEGKKERRKEGKKERRKEGKKQRRKEGKKERRKEGKKERRKEAKKERKEGKKEENEEQPVLIWWMVRRKVDGRRKVQLTPTHQTSGRPLRDLLSTTIYVYKWSIGVDTYHSTSLEGECSPVSYFAMCFSPRLS
jgi:hypothetical protein